MISRNVEHEGKKYIVSLYATSYANAIRVQEEVTEEKRELACMGFCPGNYAKKIVKKKDTFEIRIPKVAYTKCEQIFSNFVAGISNRGIDKAIKTLEERVKREIGWTVDIEKGVYDDFNTPIKSPKMTFKQVEKEKKEEILKFNFEKREEGLTFTEIQKIIKELYDIDISDNTLSKRYNEECKRVGKENIIDRRKKKIEILL